MTIIGNDCVSARIYEQLGKQFNTPFTWARIPYDDFIYILENFKIIDFNNFYVDLAKHCKTGWDTERFVGHVKIENRLDLLYSHYVQNKKHKVPTKNGLDIMYDNAISYTKEKYISRLNRMNINDKNLFAVLHQKVDTPNYDISIENCIDFIQRPLEFTKVAVVYDEELLNINNTNTHIIYIKDKHTTKDIAKKIIKNIIANSI